MSAVEEEEEEIIPAKKKTIFVDEHYYYNNRSRRSATENPMIDPSEVGYNYLLTPSSVTDIRKLASLAGAVIPTEVRRKEDLVAYLSVKLAEVLPQLTKKLTKDELLQCEILAAAGGFMTSWELATRMKIEKRKREEQQGPANSKNRGRKRRSGYDDDDEEEEMAYDDEYDYEYDYGYHRLTVLDLFVFHRLLESVNNKEAESGVYLIMPKEARQQCFSHVQESILDLKLNPLVSGANEVEKLFFESHPDLLEVLRSLLEAIAERRPKPTPKENLLPKSVISPIFQEHVAKTEFYLKNDDAQLFGWNELNEVLLAFLHSSKLVKTGDKGVLEVNSIKAQEFFSSGRRRIVEAFLKWWGNPKGNQTTLIKRKFYDFEGPKPRGLRSGETRVREILLNVITRNNSELEDGKIYSRMGLIDRCRLSRGRTNLFGDFYGNMWSPNGVVEDLFSELASMMIIYPLCFLGILEISKDSRLVRLGKWAFAPLENGTNRNLITVTPNFEVIVQPEAASSVSFQLREFCEKTSTPGPAMIFKITRKKFLQALRKDYTTEKIIALFPEVPENVSHELKSWGRRYGEVELKNMDVIRCNDETLTEMLLNDKEARGYIERRIGDLVLELKQGSRAKVLSRCDQMGLFARG